MDTDDHRLCDLDARVLRAGAPRGRSASLIAEHAGWLPDITLSTPAPPASHGLVAHAGTAPPTGGEEPATATPRRVRLMTSRDDAHHRVAGQFPVSLALDCRSPVAGASAGSPEDDRVRRAGQNARQCTAELRPNPAAARLILIPQPIDKLIGAVGAARLTLARWISSVWAHRFSQMSTPAVLPGSIAAARRSTSSSAKQLRQLGLDRLQLS